MYNKVYTSARISLPILSGSTQSTTRRKGTERASLVPVRTHVYAYIHIYLY